MLRGAQNYIWDFPSNPPVQAHVEITLMDPVEVAVSPAISQVAYARLGAEGIEAYDKLLSRLGSVMSPSAQSIRFFLKKDKPFLELLKREVRKKQFVLAEGGSPILRQTLPQKLPCQASYLAECQRPGTGSEHAA